MADAGPYEAGMSGRLRLNPCRSRADVHTR
jgi:hypothetical protein